MRNYGLILLAALACLMIACKPDGTSKGVPEDIAEDKIFPLSIELKGAYTDLDHIRAQALSIIDYRIQNSDKALSMMTSGYWWPEFVYHSGSISGEGHYDGYWIKYGDDFTYTYGVYGDTWGSGKYHYGLDNQELMLLDNDVELEPKVFQGNYNGELMSYIGKHTFGVNNGMQIKMVPLEEVPTLVNR